MTQPNKPAFMLTKNPGENLPVFVIQTVSDCSVITRDIISRYLRSFRHRNQVITIESEDFYSPSPIRGEGLFRIPKSALRLPALREPATPAEGAAFAELQETAAIRAFGAEAEVVLVSALGAIG